MATNMTKVQIDQIPDDKLQFFKKDVLEEFKTKITSNKSKIEDAIKNY